MSKIYKKKIWTKKRKNWSKPDEKENEKENENKN